ncbi:hypothetical protein HD554DRAFT_2037187 [Boletus coccyginus]|nr:hypothetical protein HD554DRAFT_2037187 [Boletus coccyginus]
MDSRQLGTWFKSRRVVRELLDLYHSWRMNLELDNSAGRISVSDELTIAALRNLASVQPANVSELSVSEVPFTCAFPAKESRTSDTTHECCRESGNGVPSPAALRLVPATSLRTFQGSFSHVKQESMSGNPSSGVMAVRVATAPRGIFNCLCQRSKYFTQTKLHDRVVLPFALYLTVIAVFGLSAIAIGVEVRLCAVDNFCLDLAYQACNIRKGWDLVAVDLQ